MTIPRNNTRTGRAVLMDPNPPPPQTYLDLPIIKADIEMLLAVPESQENQYRKPISAILNWVFPVTEGYQVTQEVDTSIVGIPDSTVFKVRRAPMGQLETYEVMMVESKGLGKPWGSTTDDAITYFENTGNESKQIYGMVHIGLELQFHRYIRPQASQLSGRLQLVRDAQQITDMLLWIKQNPLPYV